jgi:dTMP kinase
MGVDIKIINLINKFLLDNISVSFTFLNLVNKKNLYLRLKKRKRLNRYDKFNMNFYNKVQNGFLKLANLKKKSYHLINSNLDIKLNEKLILKKIDELIF